MEHILVSACLLGVNCRYNGVAKENKRVLKLLENENICLIPVCPEQLGGLTTPREPSETVGAKVINEKGIDVTEQFARGAAEALRIAKLYRCRLALLKERSPSCGAGEVYDGTFSRTIVNGDGVTAALLLANEVEVFGESQIEQLLERILEN